MFKMTKILIALVFVAGLSTSAFAGGDTTVNEPSTPVVGATVSAFASASVSGGEFPGVISRFVAAILAALRSGKNFTP